MNSSDMAPPNLWEDLILRPLLGEISRRHGIVETLALPSMRDLPPVQIATLFVSPLLAASAVSADSDPSTWPQGKSLLEELKECAQLVLLGDPGGGKTTLSNWLAWRLASGLSTPLPVELENRIPLPCILREMSAALFTPELSLPDLAVSIAVQLLGNKVNDKLMAALRTRVAAGGYALILDGIDEIPIPHRRIVAKWIKMAKQQNAVVLATSRIVGYEDGPVDHELPEPNKTSKSLAARFDEESNSVTFEMIQRKSLKYDSGENFNANDLSVSLSKKSIRWANLRYLMPFDQSRISAFAENWYRQRCSTTHEAQQKTSDFLASLAQSEVTQQLARTPNLLSLMAIVHRERAHLPDGKALLYEEIANAYINTIDMQRKINHADVLAPYPWKERKAWLAYVGYQMQQNRDQIRQNGQLKNDDGVLAKEADVVTWLAEAMELSGVDRPEQTAKIYLGWVARRSGLLLPRGEGRYAFVHLSFQEYFCACYLSACIVSPAFARNTQAANASVTKVKLEHWSEVATWTETLIYLLEILSADHGTDWTCDLIDILFGAPNVNRSIYRMQASLAARILKNQHIRIGQDRRDSLADRCSQVAWGEWNVNNLLSDNAVLAGLLDAGYAAIICPANEKTKSSGQLLLEKSISTIGEIKSPEKLRVLIVLGGYAEFSALAPNLINLRALSFAETDFEDASSLTGLAELNHLKYIDLSSTRVADISSLANIKKLSWLELGRTHVSDISPLTNLESLNILDIANTEVFDISPLQENTSITWLSISDTKVSDIKPLAKLKELRSLHLDRTKISNISPARALKKLRILSFSDCNVKNLAPLEKLEHLEKLMLNNTLVHDVSSLKNLSSLKVLSFENTKIKDISQLSDLYGLRQLYITKSQKIDTTPMTNIKGLSIIYGS
jgi:hypothetical protein